MYSLSARIGVIVTVVVALLATALVVAAFGAAKSRADILVDDDLRLQADALRAIADVAAVPAAIGVDRPVHHAATMSRSGYQLWNRDNTLAVASPDFAGFALDAMPAGVVERTIDGRRWRVLTELAGNRWIRVGEREEMRAALIRFEVIGLVGICVLVVPLVIVLTRLAVGAAIAPVDALAERIRNRLPGRSGPIGPDDLPREFEPIVAAVNTSAMCPDARDIVRPG